ncbi:non-receptor serine/threonine protein kinase [Lithospermum erythrorhizon]|uniref:Non-receptor serine/threonine protein kinase n=1 Tax=Lithospermum erythrorhizon TaxID=34254 RepID=A0AAV3QA57_LITER
MGCLCSKRSGVIDDVAVNAKNNSKLNANDNSKLNKSSIAPSRKEEVIVDKHKYGSGSRNSMSKRGEEPKAGGVARGGSGRKSVIVERPKNGTLHTRSVTIDFASGRILSVRGAKGEQSAAGWPSWLTAVAGEAIQGLLPRTAESFEKIEKVGQGTYSSVYRARDLTNNKIVAMKKVKFVNMDPESVRFMAREISILRQLDHPNVIKLEAIVTSRISETLYLVFEYMEHDLAGLLASPNVTFNESQIKCYMQQLFRGLQHCHDRGVLHRDIKGSNLLVGNNGILKIGDFGLATTFKPNQKEPLTSRVVTLWYRAPELLFGATEYGVAIDLWSAGCILGELIAGKPIMPGRTEVEQMHKIFKLCGSPSDEYWRRSKLIHATTFKPQQPYKRRLLDTFKDFPSTALALVDVLLSIDPEKRGNTTSALKSEFFKTKPLPCDPSSLPKYSPSKEFDAKLREEEAIRQKADRMRGKGAESTRTSSRQLKGIPTPAFEFQGQSSKKNSTAVKFNPLENSVRGHQIETPKLSSRNRLSHSSSVLHPKAGVYSCSTKGKVDSTRTVAPGRTFGSFKHGRESVSQEFQKAQSTTRESSSLHPRVKRTATQEPTVHVPRRNMMQYSGPLVPPGGNMEEMLKEHERLMQEAFRKSRLGGSRNRR